MTDAAYDALLGYVKQTTALSEVAGRLGWDQQTVMPTGSAHQRAEEMAAMEVVLHERKTAPQIGEWLSALSRGSLNQTQRAMVDHIEWSYQRDVKRPAALMERLARVTAQAFDIWAQARANEDVAAFLPILDELITLRREEAAALSDGPAYDALLQDYERGMSAQRISEMFDALRPRLSALRAAVADAPQIPALTGVFPKEQQMQIAQLLAQKFNYDLNMGRVDLALHPFSSGSGQDVRITTRVDESDPLNCFYSTIHEVGHATYEQNIDAAHFLTPLGQGVSLGVHESQSRIYENQLGRSRGVVSWLYEQMTATFKDAQLGSPEALYRVINRVETGFIRTEADELHYNLHVALRFTLEQALMSGDLHSGDLEAAWNDQFTKDFGKTVPCPSQGVLQDVHWSGGAFAYFPTYSLGNVYAGCLFDAMQTQDDAIAPALDTGDVDPALRWLRENVQHHGAALPAQEIIETATGHSAPNPEPLLSYLEAKYSDIYQL